jgi:hypothetical protein
MVLPCQETFSPSRYRWSCGRSVLRPLLTSARTSRVTPVAPPFRTSLTHGYAYRSPRIRSVNFRCTSAPTTPSSCRKRLRSPGATRLRSLGALMAFLFVTSQLWLRLPPHGLSPRRSCLRLVLHLDRLHLVSCPSFKFRFRTGDLHPTSSRPCRAYRFRGGGHSNSAERSFTRSPPRRLVPRLRPSPRRVKVNV